MLPRIFQFKVVSWIFVWSIGFSWKWGIATGKQFNESLWDNEIQFFNELKWETNFFANLFKPDAYGYLILPIRAVTYVVGELRLDEAIWIRVIVVFLQLLCFYVLTSTVFNEQKFLGHLTFLVLCLIPNEDMNYLFNIGYYFLLIIFSLWQKAQRAHAIRQILLGIISVLLITKPLLAVVILLCHVLETVYTKRLHSKVNCPYYVGTVFLGGIFYLLTYIFEQDKIAAPLDFQLLTIFKIIFNLPYLGVSVITPILQIGLMGKIHQNGFSTILILIAGLLLYLVSLSLITYSFLLARRKLKERNSSGKFGFISQDRVLINLTIIITVSYLSSFLVSNYYYVTDFPIWNLGYTPRIWMRYSANIPILTTVILIYGLATHLKSPRASKLLAIMFATQYIILWTFARYVFLRWYM